MKQGILVQTTNAQSDKYMCIEVVREAIQQKTNKWSEVIMII